MKIIELFGKSIYEKLLHINFVDDNGFGSEIKYSKEL